MWTTEKLKTPKEAPNLCELQRNFFSSKKSSTFKRISFYFFKDLIDRSTNTVNCEARLFPFSFHLTFQKNVYRKSVHYMVISKENFYDAIVDNVAQSEAFIVECRVRERAFC